MDEATIDRYLAWEQSHHRQRGTHFDCPTKGFGVPVGFPPDTDVTLWLPSPVTDQRIGFRAGVPFVKQIVGCLSSPEIVSLRNNVVKHSADVGPGLISMGLDFIAYASAVLLMNYDFSDDELELLLGGTGWHKPMLAHVCGGEDVLTTLAEMQAAVMPPPAPAPLFEPPTYQPSPPRSAPPSAPRAWWTRILDYARA